MLKYHFSISYGNYLIYQLLLLAVKTISIIKKSYPKRVIPNHKAFNLALEGIWYK